MNETLEHKVEKVLYTCQSKELALGYLRYEALRKLNPRQFKEIHLRNIKGERFDDMVDNLIKE